MQVSRTELFELQKEFQARELKSVTNEFKLKHKFENEY